MRRSLLRFIFMYNCFSFIFSPALANAAYLRRSQLSTESLYNMASAGDIKGLAKAVHNKNDMDITNRYGDTALCISIKRMDYRAYNNLIKAGADTTYIYNDVRTLHQISHSY